MPTTFRDGVTLTLHIQITRFGGSSHKALEILSGLCDVFSLQTTHTTALPSTYPGWTSLKTNSFKSGVNCIHHSTCVVLFHVYFSNGKRKSLAILFQTIKAVIVPFAALHLLIDLDGTASSSNATKGTSL